MPKQAKLALVIAKPSHLWSGMQSLLRTLPIEIIAEIKEPTILLKLSNEMQPDLIMLDASFFNERLCGTITRVKNKWPQTQCVVLVEGNQHLQEAYGAGADLVVQQGFPASKLVAAIEELLSQLDNDNQKINTQDEIGPIL